MRRIVLAVSLLGMSFAFWSAGPATGQTRIRFARGRTSKVVAGTLNGYTDRRIFLIRVSRGQTLRTEQAEPVGDRRITVYVRSPKREDVGDSDASCNNRREITPTEAGYYRIEVVECRKADRWRGRFTIRVSVR